MARFTEDIGLKTLRSLLDYDPKTGLFRWRVRRRGIGGFYDIGSVAGFRETLGYWCIGINRRQYKGHRLAWLHYYGSWPDEDIDHINGDRSDNRIENLRLGGKQLNPRNQKRRITNTTGFKGVNLTHSNKYMARISVNYELIYLGTFDTSEEAHAAYVAAANKHYGEFARAS